MKSHPFSSRFSKDFTVTLFGQTAILGFGIASSILAARLLGPRGRGELAAIILWPMLLAFVFSIGIDQSIVFHLGRKIFDVSEVWTATLVTGLFFPSCAVVAGIWVIPKALRLYPPEARHLAFVFLAFVPLVWLMAIPNGFLQGTLSMGTFNLLRVLSSSLYAIGLLGLWLFDRPFLGDAVAVQICALVVVMVCGFWLVQSKARPRWRWNPKSCKSLLNFGWKTQLGGLASYVNQRLDQLLLCLFVPAHDLGLYVVAVAVASSVGFFPKAAGIVTLATGSNSDSGRAREVIGKSLGATFLALLAGCTALYIICPWLIPLAFGASFAPAVTACRFLLPGSVALGLAQVLFNGARALGHPALPSCAEGLAVGVTCVSLYLLLPRYGFVGAAIASTLAYSSSLILTMVLYHKQMGFGLAELSRGALAGCQGTCKVVLGGIAHARG